MTTPHITDDMLDRLDSIPLLLCAVDEAIALHPDDTVHHNATFTTGHVERMVEELGEVARAHRDVEADPTRERGRHLRHELAQLGALVVAALDQTRP